MSDEPPEHHTAIVRPGEGGEVASPLSLVIVGPSGTGNIALPEHGTMAIGRSPECEIHIDDSRLSRRHAEIRCGAEIAIVDLGSRNGTLVRDERIAPNTPFALRPGDSIAIGGSVIVLQRAAVGVERARHVWSHGYFEARLEEECAGATAETPFSIVRLRLDTTDSSSSSGPSASTRESRGPAEQPTPPALVKWLRPTDLVGTYAPNELEVLLKKTPHDEAEARVAELDRNLRQAGVRFGMALASYPHDGRTPEALIERTTRLLRRDPPPSVEPSRVPAKGALERMAPILLRVAQGTINVLVLGETGVGKEILSRRIHSLSPRANKPLVSLNCAALSESLLESELFGHERGSFTGALQAKVGLLESADGGTVFLDEIGEMPLSVQAKLLRVIEQREVTRVGAVRPRAIDVRFVAATHRDLEAEITRGRFRQDLYFRLNGIALSIPPLRERVDEIEPLARAFVEQACRAMHRADVPKLGADALETLVRYPWPGNVRELRNAIERAVLLCSTGVITRQHLPMEKLATVGGGQAEVPVRDADEKQQILSALEACAGNQSHAAKMLGMSRQTFIRRLEEYGILRPRKRE